MWVDTAVSVEGFCPRCARAQNKVICPLPTNEGTNIKQYNYVYHERKSQKIPCKAQL